MFNYRDLYGDRYGVTTLEETAPETTEQEALANQDAAATSAKVNSKGILTWLGVIVLAVVVLSMGGGK